MCSIYMYMYTYSTCIVYVPYLDLLVLYGMLKRRSWNFQILHPK